MDSEELKQNIRRRLFEERFRKGEAASSSEQFRSCPECEWPGKVCHTSFAEGVPIAEVLDACARCEGAGFIERTA